MDKIVVGGGTKLAGEINASGSKNSSLPILFATLLADGEHVLGNVPDLKDIESALQLLTALGCETRHHKDKLIIKVKPSKNREAHYDLVRKMRASILCLGPLLARYGEAFVSLPGGCAIGSRPVNLHLDGVKVMGADVIVEQGYVRAKTAKLQGTNILFETCTVGGTENILMAASLAEGTTIIENAAKEPEIVDLANYLNLMGARIKGAGTSIITVEGVARLMPANYDIMPDRIEAGTLLLAGAITGSELTINNCEPQHLEALIVKLHESGFRIETGARSMQIYKTKTWRAVDVTTAPYPLFPTDLQAQLMATMTQAEGTTVITETVFENRFMHVQELVRLGADITPKSHVAVVRGKPGGLVGAPVMATDLRASACLVLAGLVANGETHINRIYHLDRGYEKLEKKLASVGAKIKRIMT